MSNSNDHQKQLHLLSLIVSFLVSWQLCLTNNKIVYYCHHSVKSMQDCYGTSGWSVGCLVLEAHRSILTNLKLCDHTTQMLSLTYFYVSVVRRLQEHSWFDREYYLRSFDNRNRWYLNNNNLIMWLSQKAQKICFQFSGVSTMPGWQAGSHFEKHRFLYLYCNRSFSFFPLCPSVTNVSIIVRTLRTLLNT